MRRFLRRIGLLALILLALCALPVAGVELACKAPVVAAPPRTPLLDPSERRAEGDSFLSYPEWYIVHAYADLAGVIRQSSESSFDYLAAIGGYWTSLCGATRTAASIGSATLDQRTTNYVIGLSFTAEMAIKGAWERTVGAFAVWTRGVERTAEDDYALKVADDYATFLNQTPWYKYSFKRTLMTFWSDVPTSGPHAFRKWERRLALSLEWGAKDLYAKAMDALAGAAPADLTIRSVVRPGIAGLSAIPEVTVVRPLGNSVVVETPRYAAFTVILRQLSARGATLAEIAGNTRILTTVLAPPSAMLDTFGARQVFTLPIQSRPGWRRIGLDTDVSTLTEQIAGVEKGGGAFEHAYDY